MTNETIVQEKRASEPLSIDQVEVWTDSKQYLDSFNCSLEKSKTECRFCQSND